jgi:predicted ATPase
MESRPRITRVVLENYKSIAFCDVRLGPLTILVGPNGAGKSNFLDALRFLSEAIKGPVENAFQNRGGFSKVLRRSVSYGGYLGVRIEFVTADQAAGYYSVRFRNVAPGEYSLIHERCFLDSEWYDLRSRVLTGNRERPVAPPDAAHLYLRLPLMAAYPEFSPVYSLISSIYFYNPSPKDIRQPASDLDSNRLLRADAANLANVFERFGVRDDRGELSADSISVQDRVAQYLKVVYPALTRVSTEAYGGFNSLLFYVEANNEPFFANQVSDGTLRSLAILVALFQGVAHAKETFVVGLEEPETALHPAAAGVLFDAMREASASVQVVATSHSADLLDNKDIDSDAILAVELERGVTRIGHIDQTGRKALKERMYTAGELMRMNYLRPEPQQSPNDSEIESVLFGDLVPA